VVELKSPSEIEKMRRSNRIVGEILAGVKDAVKPGVTTSELNQLAERYIEKLGCRSAFKNYRVGDAVYPAALCTSVNEEVVHGIPSDRELEEGDILSLDFGVEHEGYYGDSALTVAVGSVDEESGRLLSVAERCLYEGIEHLRCDQRVGDVGSAVQVLAEGEGFAVVRDFVGHGIGRTLHEEPQIPNFGSRGKGRKLRVGMVVALEPMINAGEGSVRVKDDGWTAITSDGSRSAHFEHTVAITGDGPDILSKV